MRAMVLDFITKEASNDFETTRIMEHMYDEGKSELFVTTCVTEVAKSDVYIIILGQTAGSECPSIPQKTYTEIEYDTAMEIGIPVYRFVCSSSEVAEKDKNGYERLKNRFNGRPTTEYTDLNDFIAKISRVFYQIKPGGSLLHDDDIGKIDRRSQVIKFRASVNIFQNEKVMFYGYRSDPAEYAHLLNYRLCKIELETKFANIDHEFYFEGLGEHAAFGLAYFLSSAGERLLGPGYKRISTIREFYQGIKNRPGISNVVLPIRIAHSLETDEEKLNQLNTLLKQFVLPENLEFLGEEKRIIFLVNIEASDQVASSEVIRKLFLDLPPQGFDHDLGLLEPVQKTDLENWIKTTVNSNPADLQAYVTKHFPGSFPMKMADCAKGAQELINEFKKINHGNKKTDQGR